MTAMERVETSLEKKSETMDQCKTCKWWGEEDVIDDEDREDNPGAPEVRKCSCPKIVYQYYDGSWSNYPKQGGAMYWDGSGYTAAFGTTETFGCVCHGPKE